MPAPLQGEPRVRPFLQGELSLASPLRGSGPQGPKGFSMIHYKHKLVGYARDLRKAMTKEERKLWYTFLKYLPKKFVRQKPLGQYIVDFYCHEAALAIELDGSQHFEEKGEAYDRQRDAFLQEQGITVLRYSNLQIAREFDSVKADILLHLGLE